VAVRGGAGRYQAAVDLVTQGAVAVHDVVSHEVAFAEAGTGLARAASEPDAVFLVMVRVP
jgi:threonine dehydrogenase-like Zn-dependent dehydrogenase